VTASPSRSSKVARALPRLLQIALGIGVLFVDHNLVRLAGVVLIGTAVMSDWRLWWRYVSTGERQGGWKPEPAFAEPGTHSVTLTEAGPRPVEVVKAVREICGADLLAAKILVEGVPSVLADAVSEASATAARERLESAGATAVVA